MSTRFVLTVALLAWATTSWAEDLRFRWALGAVTGAARDRHYVAVTEDVVLHTGDEIKMFVSPSCTCFIYVVHEDPLGAVTVLFPSNGSFSERGTAGGSRHYIPADSAWLRLDSTTGLERIYLVASSKRLLDFERLLTRPPSRSADKTLIRDVVAEIARLQKQAGNRKWSERPIAMAGQIRGDHPDVAQDAREWTGDSSFFSRVVVIDHR